MTKKRTHHKKPHVLGVVKHEDIPKIEHPLIDPMPLTEQPDPKPEVAAEDHIVVALPESIWQKFTRWFGSN